MVTGESCVVMLAHYYLYRVYSISDHTVYTAKLCSISFSSVDMVVMEGVDRMADMGAMAGMDIKTTMVVMVEMGEL